ncbi:MAG: NADH-quinone oxidoreductase subunit NuoE [Bacteroidetes bacterium]|nr:MAG: NADH-quinone oxidoreductase subunit NuoE [Bacteroidota bacterium]
MSKNIDSIINKFTNSNRDNLIPILQEIQNTFGYLSEDAIISVGKHFDLPTSKIYGIATFYDQFVFKPKGKYHILLCNGTSCHTSGSKKNLTEIEKILKIKDGETTSDGIFSLQTVDCIGACALAPVISVNGKFYSKVDLIEIKKIIKFYQSLEK